MSKEASATYQEYKEKIQKKSHERYQNLSEEGKNKNRTYARERYKNLAEDEKQKPVEYRKKYCGV